VANLKELREQFAEAAADIQAFRNRDEWTAEDKKNFEEVCERYDSLDEQIQEQERVDARIARIAEVEERHSKEQSEARSEVGQARQTRSIERGERAPTEEMKLRAFQKWLQRDSKAGFSLSDEDKHMLRELGYGDNAGDEVIMRRYNSNRQSAGQWADYNGINCQPQQRANLTVGVAGDGGETVPEGFVQELETTMEAFGGLRRVCRILSTESGNDLPWPTMNDTSNSGALLAENTTFGTSVEPTFAQIVFNAYKISSTPMIASRELLTDSAFVLPSIIGAALGERIGRGLAGYLATGTGSSQPQGITVGASAGVTAASATVIDVDELIDLQASLDEAYEGSPNVGWAMNKAVLTNIRQLKSDTGTGYDQYLWQPGLQAGTPALLLGRPVAVVEEMPAQTTGLVPIVYGDMSKFVCRDAGPMAMFVMSELFRQTDCTGFVAFSRHDSKVIQSAAIKKLTMA
jgi:HK97 family phage major capsid protein